MHGNRGGGGTIAVRRGRSKQQPASGGRRQQPASPRAGNGRGGGAGVEAATGSGELGLGGGRRRREAGRLARRRTGGGVLRSPELVAGDGAKAAAKIRQGERSRAARAARPGGGGSGPARACLGPRGPARWGGERGGGWDEVAASDWAGAATGMTWRAPISRSEVAAGGGHVRRGVDASGGARRVIIGFQPRIFRRRSHIYR